MVGSNKNPAAIVDRWPYPDRDHRKCLFVGSQIPTPAVHWAADEGISSRQSKWKGERMPIHEQQGLEDVAQNGYKTHSLCMNWQVLLELSLLKNIENMDTLSDVAGATLIFSLGTPKFRLKESGPLLMEQELGYTLAVRWLLDKVFLSGSWIHLIQM